MAKIQTSLTIDTFTNDNLAKIAKKLNTNKSDLATNVIDLGLLVMFLVNYEDLENIEETLRRKFK